MPFIHFFSASIRLNHTICSADEYFNLEHENILSVAAGSLAVIVCQQKRSLTTEATSAWSPNLTAVLITKL